MKKHEPDKVVKLVFSAYEKVSADLKIRLRYDNLTQTKFFAGIMRLYLENDQDMTNVIYKIKSHEGVMGKKKLNRSKKEIEYGEELMKELGITESEREDMYDMIESGPTEYE
jgi:hypothetical protein